MTDDTHTVIDTKSKLRLKLNAFRKEAIAMDWKDDGRVEFKGGVGYKYLSADKVKRQLSPLLAKHGLEMEFRYCDLVRHSPPDSNVYHFTVKLEAALVDVETGEGWTSSLYGEGVDTGDKAMPKAQTAALRMWLTTYLLIADGMDPDAEPRARFNASPSEKEDMRSAVLAAAIPPAPVQPTPKTKSSKSPQTAQNLVEKPEEASDGQEPVSTAEAPQTANATAFKPAAPLLKAIARISESMLKRSQDGTIPMWEYEAYMNELKAASSSADYNAILKRYKL